MEVRRTKAEIITWLRAAEKRQQDWQQEVKNRWAERHPALIDCCEPKGEHCRFFDERSGRSTSGRLQGKKAERSLLSFKKSSQVVLFKTVKNRDKPWPSLKTVKNREKPWPSFRTV